MVSIIGAGISGLVAACYLARDGEEVHVFEKNSTPGGRARQFTEAGFTFDMGPSWYWMPELIEEFFRDFGKSAADYYELQRLSPSYTVYFEDRKIEVPSSLTDLTDLFEQLEPGSGRQLHRYLDLAAKKYRLGMGDYARRPSLTLREFVTREVGSAVINLQILSNMAHHVNAYFRHPLIRRIMQFPVLFLGAMPERIPAMYSLMNYADCVLGTWYPMGGMHGIIRAMYQLALESGVYFHFDCGIQGIRIQGDRAVAMYTPGGEIRTDYVVGSGDYHHIEGLLPQGSRSYDSTYWAQREMAPSSLLFYLGIDSKLPLTHHSLFFDADFGRHAAQLYRQPSWPDDPLFYVCAPSVTDPAVAPPGKENLFILIPVAAGLADIPEEEKDRYLDLVMQRLEKHTGVSIRPRICYKRAYSLTDFSSDYNAFKGNAYGLANTLRQTAFLKPSLQSKKVKNLCYCGQLTVPGPGVPPAILSGRIAASHTLRYIRTHSPITI